MWRVVHLYGSGLSWTAYLSTDRQDLHTLILFGFWMLCEAAALTAPHPSCPSGYQQISKTYTHWAATILFLFFGGRMLYEAATNAHAGENELDEVEKELEVGLIPVHTGAHCLLSVVPPRKSMACLLCFRLAWLAVVRRCHSYRRDAHPSCLHPSVALQAADKSPKPAGGSVSKQHPLLAAVRGAFSPVLLEAFTLTFLAEWGDRSQIATIGERLGFSRQYIACEAGSAAGHGPRG